MNQDKKNWKCPKCSESLESQFNACWNCGFEDKDKKNKAVVLDKDTIPIYVEKNKKIKKINSKNSENLVVLALVLGVINFIILMYIHFAAQKAASDLERNLTKLSNDLDKSYDKFLDKLPKGIRKEFY